MEALNFIVAHWEKFAFIGAAIGYILKVILDHTYKKKEIYYNLYSSEEMKAVLGFFKQYNNVQLEMAYFIGTAKHKKFTREELSEIEDSVKQYLDTAMTASFFLNESN